VPDWGVRVQSLLESDSVLGVGAHRGQKDGGQAPYILHPPKPLRG